MASATELVIAFGNGSGGSFKFALHGLVDIRLAMIILGGSLFEFSLGLWVLLMLNPSLLRWSWCHNGHRAFQPGANGASIYGSVGAYWKLGESTSKMLSSTSFAIMIFRTCGWCIYSASVDVGRPQGRAPARS